VGGRPSWSAVSQSGHCLHMQKDLPQEVEISCITVNVKEKWAKLSAPTPLRHIWE